MSVAKSDLIKELADSYPNFLRKDLNRLIDIALYEMTNAIKRGERVELRDVFSLNLASSITILIEKAAVSSYKRGF